jgi:alpha-glucosidase
MIHLLSLRPAFCLGIGLVLVVLVPEPIVGQPAVRYELSSPGGVLGASILVSSEGRLTWSLQRGGTPVVEPSPLGVIVDDVDLGDGVSLGTPAVSEIDERYSWRGVKREATNRCRGYELPVRHTASGTRWVLEVRLFDDGFACRYRVPGAGTRRVQGESTSWTLTEGSQAWFQTNTGDYEGVYERQAVADLPQQSQTDRGPRPVYFGPPVTVELPETGILLITEANLFRYSGMTLRSSGARRLTAAFEDDPQGFLVEGEILSPWRVAVCVPDLDALVNSDVVHNLCDPPDPRMFPEGVRTSWIRPGKALITWCVFGNEGARWHLQKWFVDQCAALHCEYLLVDAGWRTERWGWLADGGDVWARLAELCEYAADRNVGIVVWHAYPEGRDDGPGLTRREDRIELFRRCEAAGVKGIKIDFFNSESRETIEVYEDLLRLGAEHRLTINFHGANKPTGEVRTWPNEVTREGIREQEYLLWDQLPLPHYSALPFTRMTVGHSDFLPTYVRARFLKNTTATFQMAAAIIATTTFLCWPDHPDDYRASPFLGLVQSMPLDWHETRVLPESRIGQLTAFARRADDAWFVGVLNSSDHPREWETPATFLGPAPMVATLYRDTQPHPTGVQVVTGHTLTRTDTLRATLPPGGGFVAWIKPRMQP